jgi:hypothetical protein
MYGIRIRKFDNNGEIIDDTKRPMYKTGMTSARVHHYNDEEPAEISKPIINENMDIIQAKTDKYGILQRTDEFTGENLNEIIDFKGKPEKKKDVNESKTKFIPGERLLLTIKNEKPELLEKIRKPNYKPLTSTKKDKLRKLLNKLN